MLVLTIAGKEVVEGRLVGGCLDGSSIGCDGVFGGGLVGGCFLEVD